MRIAGSVIADSHSDAAGRAKANAANKQFTLTAMIFLPLTLAPRIPGGAREYAGPGPSDAGRQG